MHINATSWITLPPTSVHELLGYVPFCTLELPNFTFKTPIFLPLIPHTQKVVSRKCHKLILDTFDDFIRVSEVRHISFLEALV